MKELNLHLAIGVICIMAAGCSNESDRTKKAILRVMKADTELTEKRKALPPRATPTQVSWVVGLYCNDLEKLDMTDCPADFRVAYKQHMRAWREAETAINQLPDTFLEGVFMGAVNTLLRGERDGGQKRLEGGVRQALERVRTTWEEVEKVGARYGAAL